jgi:hypothetical protein
MLEILWGLKTYAILDVWTIEHILSGVSIGSAVKKKNHKTLQKLLKIIDHDHHSWWFAFSGVLFLAYFWETIEHYLETGLAGSTVEYWFQGIEFWPNRIIADPLMLILGYLIAKKFPRLVWPARILSITWLILHVFVFPHSMYLHEIF